MRFEDLVLPSLSTNSDTNPEFKDGLLTLKCHRAPLPGEQSYVPGVLAIATHPPNAATFSAAALQASSHQQLKFAIKAALFLLPPTAVLTFLYILDDPLLFPPPPLIGPIFFLFVILGLATWALFTVRQLARDPGTWPVAMPPELVMFVRAQPPLAGSKPGRAGLGLFTHAGGALHPLGQLGAKVIETVTDMSDESYTDRLMWSERYRLVEGVYERHEQLTGRKALAPPDPEEDGW